MSRERLLSSTRKLNWVTAGLILILLACFSLPYFEYPGGEKTVISIWGYLGFPVKFEQMESLLDVKFLNIKHLNVPLILIVFGIVSILTLILKKGIATQLFPLFWSVYGLIGYFTSEFILLGNTYAYYIHIIIIAITFLVVAANIVLYVIELKTRPETEYLDMDAWSA
ncbi:MAG: hypothetical protein ACOX7I_05250 [Oscillospiraceae bacterium]|jgi:hypothetical protein